MNGTSPNRLISEKSPYLLQHAYNPVNWYPWGKDAFERAKNENKLIFLSIGYSTCHWCHVMEKESFEDPDIAKLMNEAFVCIKVDREERPDIDSVYMSACQMMTGTGGWPLTVIMTTEKKPLFVSTYLPKTSGFGRLGMKELIPSIKEFWESQNEEALRSAEKFSMFLEHASTCPRGETLSKALLDDAFEELGTHFDEQHGGFTDKPKFPIPHNLTFLLRYWKRTATAKALEMVELTLDSMRLGGIWDHIGFGFHRYSTDSTWTLPHFEKMLYDQALLAFVYLEAYQAMPFKKEYGQTAREIFTYVMRDMTDREGAFYSAQDADSEGEEGKFYLWTQEEIGQVLSKDDARLANEIFNISDAGNFSSEISGVKTGKNILHFKKPLSDIGLDLSISVKELEIRLEKIKNALFQVRELRLSPHKDDKILTDWNGMMIAALAKGAQVLSEPIYEQAAKRAADFIFAKMIDKEGRLFHRYRAGEAAIPAFLDDYASIVWGLLELYETTFISTYLEKAVQLTEKMLDHFWDFGDGGFYFSADDSDRILIRKKEIYDGAVPSGNSIAALDLLRLAHLTGDLRYEKKAQQISYAFSRMISRFPASHTQMMVALDFAFGPASETVVVGDPEAEDTKVMLTAVRKGFFPNNTLILCPTRASREESIGITRLAPFTHNFTCIKGKATAYICKSFSCDLPTHDVKKVISLLDDRNKQLT